MPENYRCKVVISSSKMRLPLATIWLEDMESARRFITGSKRLFQQATKTLGDLAARVYIRGQERATLVVYYNHENK